MKAKCVTILAAGVLAMAAATARAESEFIDLSPAGVPNYLGGIIGGAPDYIGSDDYGLAGAPVGRYSWGERYIDIQANFISANVLDNTNWRFGPAATIRLGRRDPDDAVVDRLPDVDPSLDLGAFVGYQIVDPSEPRDRWVFSADATHDVTGEHGGFTVSAVARKWFPVREFAAFSLSVATTFGSDDYMDTYFSVTPSGAAASGLAPFAADAGFRDVRITGAFMQPLSEQWLVGGGLMYKRLIGDASDTPITDVRGSANQFIFGVGAAYMF